MTYRVPLQAFLLVLLVLPAISAQETAEKVIASPPASASTAAPTTKPKSTSAAAKAKLEQQRSLALSLLVSLANDARSFRDQKLRARTLARVADGIWRVDADQGRALFLRAWDAAEVADQDAARERKEEMQRQQAEGRGGGIFARQPDLRSEVLRLAAKRERALGEELLDKLKQARTQDAADTPAQRPEALDTPEAIGQRLSLARQLLDVDVPRALQFADPALATVTMPGLNFLSFLREKDAAAADQRYLRMLARSEADAQSDANTASMLSSYVFTPHMFVTFDRSGGANTSQMGRPTPPATTPELRAAFFRVATQILMRPLAPPEQDRTTSGIEGKYLIITRLLPLFEQFATPQAAELMRGQLAGLSGSVREETRNRDDETMRRGIRDEQPAADNEQSLLDQIARAKTSDQRDQLYVGLIMRTLERGDLRARDFVDKVESSDLRKQLKPFVDMSLTISFIDKKKSDDALKLTADGELTHFQRVWALTQVARQLSETDRDKALTLLGNALNEARRIDTSDADRPRALIGLANALFAMDRTRAWELVGEAVGAANSSGGFSGEDSRLTLQLRTPGINSVRTNSTENFDLPAIFRTLTKDDYHRAVGLARTFEADSPRATALISVAQALLSDK
ncbi:MAG TPA: hypothetical protein VE056_13765 [Pyrinomonadaceae bacterium]|nr:hypothetical protein [Pyrinomonadaceae bacterium]